MLGIDFMKGRSSNVVDYVKSESVIDCCIGTQCGLSFFAVINIAFCSGGS